MLLTCHPRFDHRVYSDVLLRTYGQMAPGSYPRCVVLRRRCVVCVEWQSNPYALVCVYVMRCRVRDSSHTQLTDWERLLAAKPTPPKAFEGGTTAKLRWFTSNQRRPFVHAWHLEPSARVALAAPRIADLLVPDRLHVVCCVSSPCGPASGWVSFVHAVRGPDARTRWSTLFRWI